MPNQNNTDQNPAPNASSGIPFSPQADLPPLPPEFQNINSPESSNNSQARNDSGSAAPIPQDFSNITVNPKKKFGGGKVIATILGILVLVGGVGAGIVMTQQKQLFQQKAATGSCSGFCSTNGNCPESAKGDGTGTNGGNGCDVGQYCCIGGNTSPSSASGSNTCDNSASTASVCRGKSFGYVADSDWNSAAGCQSGFNPDSCVNGIELACENTSGTLCAANCKCKRSGGIGQSNPITRDWPSNGTQCQKPSWSGSPNSSIGGCIVYFCPNGCSGGCGESNSGVYWKSRLGCSDAVSQLGSYCGQVDTIDTSGFYCVADPNRYNDSLIQCGNCAKPPVKTTPPITSPTNPPTPSPAAPYCAAIHVYDTEWNLISQSANTTSLSTLKPGDTIRFTVEGSPAAGIDMAKFTVNARIGEVDQSAVSEEITAKKPGTNEFYYEYTIPSGATFISVSGQIHSSLGWF